MKTAEIRTSFVEFFTGRDHRHLPGSPLVPHNDPTLLFTNAGMVQFKDIFLGREQPPHPEGRDRAALPESRGQAQRPGKCRLHGPPSHFLRDAGQFQLRRLLQAGGGPPGLGNSSPGTWACRPRKLLVTIYEDDDDAAQCWREEAGIEDSRIIPLGGSGNFWSMGDTGPCGPCSEIFYDHGPDVAGGPPGSADEEGDRFVEIWNLVFMQYDRDAEGKLTPLPKPSVDTGMGLERMAAVLQGVNSNYDIDLFRRLIAAAAEITASADRQSSSLKVIADHARAAAFLVGDGVFPSNEGRGYVLRRIIRRALRHGHDLGVNEPFLYRMVGPIYEQMGAAFPELARVTGIGRGGCSGRRKNDSRPRWSRECAT